MLGLHTKQNPNLRCEGRLIDYRIEQSSTPNCIQVLFLPPHRLNEQEF